MIVCEILLYNVTHVLCTVFYANFRNKVDMSHVTSKQVKQHYSFIRNNSESKFTELINLNVQ